MPKKKSKLVWMELHASGVDFLTSSIKMLSV